MEDRWVSVTLPLTERGLGVLLVMLLLVTLTGMVWLALSQMEGKPKRAPAFLTLISFTYVFVPIWLFLFAGTLWSIWWAFNGEPFALTASGSGGLFGLGAIVAALLGAPFVVWGAIVKQRTLDLQDAAHFNDKITSAAQGLAARHQVTRVVGRGERMRVLTEWHDDLVSRANAIGRLEALASERPESAAKIARMLSIYVRELSREHPAQVPPNETTPDQFRRWAWKLKPVRTDMELAAQSIGRLQNIKGHTIQPGDIDLRRANLQGFNLERSDFSGAMLREARLDGAFFAGRVDGVLKGASFRNANLLDTGFIGAHASDSQFQGANLGADFTAAILDGSTFEFFESDDKSNISTSFHGRYAKFTGAQVLNATFAFCGNPTVTMRWVIGADFTGASMSGSLFDGYNHFYSQNWPEKFHCGDKREKGLAFRNCQLMENIQTRCALDLCFGDGSVTLADGAGPESTSWPSGWPKGKLSDAEYARKLQEWRGSSS